MGKNQFLLSNFSFKWRWKVDLVCSYYEEVLLQMECGKTELIKHWKRHLFSPKNLIATANLARSSTFYFLISVLFSSYTFDLYTAGWRPIIGHREHFSSYIPWYNLCISRLKVIYLTYTITQSAFNFYHYNFENKLSHCSSSQIHMSLGILYRPRAHIITMNGSWGRLLV